MLAQLLLVVALLLAPSLAHAQVRGTARDSLTADSLKQKSDSSDTERLLAAEGQTKVRLRTMPRLGFGDLEPTGTRIVLTRDSIEWAPARTVAELLAAFTPTFLWRGGWLNRPELPNVLGRGATSVEYIIDGIPYLPIGQDSVVVDPSLWTLGLIDRIEIERAPGSLRVFLFTHQHASLAPRTAIGVSTGD